MSMGAPHDIALDPKAQLTFRSTIKKGDVPFTYEIESGLFAKLNDIEERLGAFTRRTVEIEDQQVLGAVIQILREKGYVVYKSKASGP